MPACVNALTGIIPPNTKGKTMKYLMTTSLIAILLAAPLAQAQSATPRADAREVRQQQRIDQGVASGQLTTREANRLDHGQAHVEAVEAKAKADGVVTKKEKVRLEQAQDVQSKRIARQKHDRQHDLNHDGKKDRPRGS
jgi:hypothetical protein